VVINRAVYGRIALVTVLCAVIGLALWNSSPTSITGLGSSEAAISSSAVDGPGLADAGQLIGGPARTPANHDVDSVLDNALSVLKGRVLDEQFHTPVLAAIRQGQMQGTLSQSEGQFVLPLDAQQPLLISVEAEGYQDRRIDVSELDLTQPQEIVLRPVATAALSVRFDDGRPATDMTVSWKAAVDTPERGQIRDWMLSRGHTSGRVHTSRTDDNGLCKLAIGTPVLATIQAAEGYTLRTVRLRPGQHVALVLPVQVTTVRLVDADSREPMAGMELDVWFPADPLAMSQAITSDSQGLMALRPSSFPILLRRPRSQLWQEELVPLSAGLSTAGTGGAIETMVSIDRDPGAGEVLVGVRPCRGRVRLVDSVTGLPVDAPVRVTVRKASCALDGLKVTACTLTTARSAAESADEVYAPVNGLLTLPCVLPAADAGATAAQPLAVVIAVAGYYPWVGELNSLPLSRDAGLHEVQLQPAVTRSLRIVHADGTPYRQAVRVYAARGDMVVWSDRGRVDGLHGPMDWFGGDLRLNLGEERNWTHTIQQSELVAKEEVAVVVVGDLGTITVRGIPDGYPAYRFCAKLGVGLGGTVYRPSRFDAGSCHFEGLPSGSYMVGPEAWVLGAELQSMAFEPKEERGLPHRTRVEVRGGQQSLVDWISYWSIGVEVGGRVRVIGTRDLQPLVVPLYGTADSNSRAEDETGIPRISFGRRAAHLPLDETGSYRLAAMEPLPLLLVVCVAYPGPWGTVQGLQIVATLMPGESMDVPTGTLELRGEPANDQPPISVKTAVEASSLRIPVDASHLTRQGKLHVGRTLVWEGVPTSVSTIQLNDKRVPIVLKAGETTILTVNLQTLAASPVATGPASREPAPK
jgi:hypothetical protein